MGGWSTKWAVAAVVGTALIYYRNAFILLYLAGGAAATIAAKSLKLLLKQARPSGATKYDPGMPSSHATNLFYLAAGLAQPWYYGGDALAAGGVLAAATVLAALRVLGGQHTVPQVVAGAALGSGMAVGWWELFVPAARPSVEGLVEAVGDRGMLGLAALLLAYILFSLGPLEAHYNAQFKKGAPDD
jgi:dolichyldiphosphatase